MTYKNDTQDIFIIMCVPIRKRILEFLESHGPATMKEIEQQRGISQRSVSYTIRKLTERGGC